MVQVAPVRAADALVEVGLEALLSEVSAGRSRGMRRVFADRRTVDGQVCDVEIHEVSPVRGANYIVVVRPVGRLPDETELRRRFSLTRKQARVALLLLDRLSDREIAETLGIAHETARVHVKIVRLKMNARNRREIPEIIRALAQPAGSVPQDTTY